MLTEEDNFVVRMKKGEIATWTTRVEMAKQQGNPQLLQKALKYKNKYEKELAELLKLLAVCEERDRLQLLKPDQLEEQGCPLCYLFENVLTSCDDLFPDEELGTFGRSPEYLREMMREAAARMGRHTNANVRDMEAAIATSSNHSASCADCRIKCQKMLMLLQLMKDEAEEEP